MELTSFMFMLSTPPPIVLECVVSENIHTMEYISISMDGFLLRPPPLLCKFQWFQKISIPWNISTSMDGFLLPPLLWKFQFSVIFSLKIFVFGLPQPSEFPMTIPGVGMNIFCNHTIWLLETEAIEKLSKTNQ